MEKPEGFEASEIGMSQLPEMVTQAICRVCTNKNDCPPECDPDYIGEEVVEALKD